MVGVYVLLERQQHEVIFWIIFKEWRNAPETDWITSWSEDERENVGEARGKARGEAAREDGGNIRKGAGDYAGEFYPWCDWGKYKFGFRNFFFIGLKICVVCFCCLCS